MSKKKRLKSRDWRVYLEDMLPGCQKVIRYTSDMTTLEELTREEVVYDGTLHNLQLIGEAARDVPDDIRDQMPNVAWKAIIGLRNVIVHGYFAIDNEIVWEIIQHRVPDLEHELETFLNVT